MARVPGSWRMCLIGIPDFRLSPSNATKMVAGRPGRLQKCQFHGKLFRSGRNLGYFLFTYADERVRRIVPADSGPFDGVRPCRFLRERQNFLLNRAVAQSGSAHVWGTCGRWFESSRPDQLSFPSCFANRGDLTLIPKLDQPCYQSYVRRRVAQEIFPHCRGLGNAGL